MECNFHVRLICWHCGAWRDALTNGPAQFAFEVAQWADDVGMRGFIDMKHNRALVFCNEDHAQKQMTKDGEFRLRPKKTKGAQ